jgi:hypothetical protein
MLLIFRKKIPSSQLSILAYTVDVEILQFFVDTARMRTLREGVN